MVNSLLTTNTQVNHADIALHVTAINRAFENPMIARFWIEPAPPDAPHWHAMITHQAQIIAYIDDYKLLMVATLVVIPLLVVFKRSSGNDGQDHTLVVE